MSAISKYDGSGIEWGVAVTVALVVHGAVYWWANTAETPATALGAGFNGIEISLGASGSSPASSVSALQPQEVAAEDVRAENVTEVQAVEAQEMAMPVEIVEAIVEEVETVDTPEIVEARIVEPAKPVVKPVVPPLPEVTKAEPVRQVQAKPAEAASIMQEAAAPESATDATVDDGNAQQSIIGGGGQSGATDSGETGDGNQTAGGGVVGDHYDYRATLGAYLERYKEYPRRARRRGIEGVVTLWFLMRRDGEVLEYEIRESSGNRLLDSAVEKMIERASPLPPFPDEMDAATFELTVPVHFFIS